MAENGTGWVAIEKSSAKHKPEDIEAAHHLAEREDTKSLSEMKQAL